MRLQSRRSVVISAGSLLATRVLPAWQQDPWLAVGQILNRVKPPDFPDRDFDVIRYGAAGDGATNCTTAIHKAIDACSAASGGRVVIPTGTFLSGAIHLKSNVNLHVSAGATLLFSRDPKHYLPVVFSRWEGVECMNYSPFLYAFEQSNIAITGAGTLDGNSDSSAWWPWKGQARYGWKKGDVHQAEDRNQLFAMAEKDVPVADRIFGDGHYLRPQFIQPYRCNNVLIEGVTIRNSPMWEVHPVLCRNVIVRNVKIASHGPNNDGCDPESCTDVLIEGCLFDTGDDCIAIKSGRNRDGRRLAQACENLLIRNCEMKDGHGGVTIGSEASGGVRNVFVEDCRMDSPNLDRALRIKTNSYRGGTIENVFLRKIRVGQVADAVVHVDFFYEEGAGGPHLPLVRNIAVEDLTCRKANYAFYLRGFANSPIRDVRLLRCAFEQTARDNVIQHVEGLRFTDVSINGARISS